MPASFSRECPQVSPIDPRFATKSKMSAKECRSPESGVVAGIGLTALRCGRRLAAPAPVDAAWPIDEVQTWQGRGHRAAFLGHLWTTSSLGARWDRWGGNFLGMRGEHLHRNFRVTRLIAGPSGRTAPISLRKMGGCFPQGRIRILAPRAAANSNCRGSNFESGLGTQLLRNQRKSTRSW